MIVIRINNVPINPLSVKMSLQLIIAYLLYYDQTFNSFHEPTVQ